MSLVIPQLMPRPGVPRAEDKDMLCRLPSSATAAEGGRHRGGSLVMVTANADQKKNLTTRTKIRFRRH